MTSTPRQRFTEIAGLADQDIDLAEAALVIAAEESPDVDVPYWLDRLDRLAEELRPRLAGVSGDLERLGALTTFLYRDLGLRGNGDDYYDPRNSFLNEVLERRLGIPLTLGIVAMEVGRRVGVPLEGVGFPGHFLLRLARHPQVLLDPFEGGRVLTVEDCEEILDRLSGGQIEFQPTLLQPVGPRQMLLRMLYNLRGVYLRRGEVERGIRVIDRLLLLDPHEPEGYRDRGLLRLQSGDLGGGIGDLERYLAEQPEDPDEAEISALIAEARRRLLAVN